MARLRAVLGSVLDKTIVFSFDQTGYRLHSSSFVADDVDVDMTGRVCLITGANAGVGRAVASALATRGAHVRLLCRNAERGAEAVAAIRRQSKNDQVHVDVLDVASLADIRTFVGRLPVDKVDVLVHNAGGILDARSDTAEGLERTFATHVAGPFLLTELLAGKLQAAGSSRVIFVASGGMYTQKLEIDDIQWRQRPYDGIVAYALAKRAQVGLAEHWAARHAPRGVAFFSMHPGWVDSAAVRTSLPHFWRVMHPLLRTADEGADTVLWLAVNPKIADRTGLFWFDRRNQKTHLVGWTREDPGESERLWSLCASVTAEASTMAKE